MMTPRELLTKGAEELAVDLTIEQVNSLFVHLAEMKKWSRRINLTSIRDERDVIIKHVLDSLSFLKGFDPGGKTRLLDLGSGAGFPAFPIKVAKPGISISLVESVKKKASFLRHVIRTLELAGAEVLDERIEDLHASLQGQYDVVTARAFAAMAVALAAGTPFLRTGGLLVLSRGPEETVSEEELLKGGVVVDKKIELTLPHSNYRRAIWVFRNMR